MMDRSKCLSGSKKEIFYGKDEIFQVVFVVELFAVHLCSDGSAKTPEGSADGGTGPF